MQYFDTTDYGIHHDYREGIGKNARKKKKAKQKQQKTSRKANR